MGACLSCSPGFTLDTVNNICAPCLLALFILNDLIFLFRFSCIKRPLLLGLNSSSDTPQRHHRSGLKNLPWRHWPSCISQQRRRAKFTVQRHWQWHAECLARRHRRSGRVYICVANGTFSRDRRHHWIGLCQRLLRQLGRQAARRCIRQSALHDYSQPVRWLVGRRQLL